MEQIVVIGAGLAGCEAAWRDLGQILILDFGV